jgi:hypothetical protein
VIAWRREKKRRDTDRKRVINSEWRRIKKWNKAEGER